MYTVKRLRSSEVRELASERLKVIKPLCEEAIGRHIEDVTIRVHGRLLSSFLVDVWYPVKKACTTPFEGHWGAELFTRSLDITVAPVLFTLRGILGLVDSDFRAKSGYAVTGENIIIAISTSAICPGTPEFDYFLAHELTHLLTPDIEKRYCGSTGFTLYEGLGTYYGEKVATILNPEFSVSSIEDSPRYIHSYQFIISVANISSQDPFQVLLQHPVREPLTNYLIRLREIYCPSTLAG